MAKGEIASGSCQACQTALLSEPLDGSSYIRCPCCGHGCRVRGRVPPDHYEQVPSRSLGLESEVIAKYEKRIAWLKAQGLVPATRLLEIGCSEGGMAQGLRDAGVERLEGMELSSDADRAEPLFDKIWRSFVEDWAQEMPSSYDLILSFHVLEHVDDIVSHLKAIATLLGKAGAAVLEIPLGGGHRLLTEDPNREHLHSFTVASFTQVVQRTGLSVEFLQTGFEESTLYSHSLRAILRHELGEQQRQTELRARFERLPKEGVVVVGLGGDFEGYVRPRLGWFKCLGVADAKASGTTAKGDTQFAPTAHYVETFGQVAALISSYRFRREIRDSLLTQGLADDLIFDLHDLFE